MTDQSGKLEEVAWAYRAEKAEAELKAIQSDLIDADIVRGREFRALEAKLTAANDETALLMEANSNLQRELRDTDAAGLAILHRLETANSLLNQIAMFVKPGASALIRGRRRDSVANSILEYLKETQ